jgi:hypothetical protein
MSFDYARGPARRGHGDKKYFCASAPVRPGRLEIEDAENGDLPMDADLAAARRWFAEDLRLRAPVKRNLEIVAAFAAVPRERFLGPGPWRIRPDKLHEPPFTTPDDQPHWLCHDVLVSIDETRGLNNGLPSFWAHNFDHLDLRRPRGGGRARPRVRRPGARQPGALAAGRGRGRRRARP